MTTAEATTPTAELWIVVIDHRHGTDVSLHVDEKQAHAHLVAYVREWWTGELDEPLPPEGDDEGIVDRYFEKVDDEYYAVTTATLSEDGFRAAVEATRNAS